MTTVVEDTLQLGPVHVIAASPVTGGGPALSQLALSLGGESEPAPPVLTLVHQAGPVLQGLSNTGAVLSHHTAGVTRVWAEHRLGERER